VRGVAGDLPRLLVENLATVLRQSGVAKIGKLKTAVHTAVPQPHYRASALRLIDTWTKRAPDISAEAVAIALLSAAESEEFHRENEKSQIVWTGPDVEAVPPRRTEQALLQVIGSAKARLTIVSFVAYKVPAVSSAVAEAARRDVDVRLVLESHEASEGKVAFDALKAFGPGVAERATVYVWPLDKRPKSASGQHGLLHAKCAVADGKELLISSANLTQNAFSLNIELGVLLRGGPLPGRVQSYFDSLINSGVLQEVG